MPNADKLMPKYSGFLAGLTEDMTSVMCGRFWRSGFLKAQRGTFSPFTLRIDASRFSKPAVLVYVRAVRRDPPPAPFRNDRAKSRVRREGPVEEEFAVDAIFPAELASHELSPLSA